MDLRAVLAVGIACCACSCSKKGSDVSHFGQTELPAKLASFDRVWELARDLQGDWSLSSANWPAARSEFRPRVAEADPPEARALINRMLRRLQPPHWILEPSAQAVPSEDVFGGSAFGFELSVHGGKLYVAKVQDGSEAQKKGVVAGAEVVRLGKDSALLSEQINASKADSTPKLERLGWCDAATWVSGHRSSELAITLKNPSEKTSEIRLRGEDGASALDARANSEARSVGDAGVFRAVPLESGKEQKRFAAQLKDFKMKRGIVLDLRGHHGGSLEGLRNIAGYWIDGETQVLAYWVSRKGKIPLVLKKQDWVYKGTIAILVDGCTASMAELLAGGLQNLGRARVFGEVSLGAMIAPERETLPSGDVLSYLSGYGSLSESESRADANVTPDHPIVFNPKALRAKRDPTLDAALAWIRTEPSANDKKRKRK